MDDRILWLLAGGALVLLANWIQESRSRWMTEHSRLAMQTALEGSSQAFKAMDTAQTIQRATTALEQQSRDLKALDLTIGHVWAQAQNRTVLRKDFQVGETAPGSPARTTTEPIINTPPGEEGFAPPPNGGQKGRQENALAEAT